MKPNGIYFGNRAFHHLVEPLLINDLRGAGVTIVNGSPENRVFFMHLQGRYIGHVDVNSGTHAIDYDPENEEILTAMRQIDRVFRDYFLEPDMDHCPMFNPN